MATQDDRMTKDRVVKVLWGLLVLIPHRSIQKAKSELSSKHFSNYEFGQRISGCGSSYTGRKYSF